MRLRTSCTTALLTLTLLVGAIADDVASPLTPSRDRTQHFEKAIFANSAGAPVTVKVNGTFDNCKLSQTLPYVFVVPSRGKTEAFNAKAKDPRAYFSFQTTEDYRFGDYRVSTANRPLQLPYAAGQGFEVLASGPSGDDFAMPEGTPVMAVKEGLVISTEASFSAGGEDEKLKSKTNYVEVAHADGTVARYTHLKAVTAKLGSTVKAGDKLGDSGKVGYAKQPMLHFELTVPTRELGSKGIAHTFTVDGAAQALTVGSKPKR